MFSLVSVCQSVIPSVYRGSPCNHYLELFKLVPLWTLKAQTPFPHYTGTPLDMFKFVHLDPNIQGPPPLDMFKLVHLDLTVQGSPSRTCWKVGG